jgi:hypothetical protein
MICRLLATRAFCEFSTLADTVERDIIKKDTLMPAFFTPAVCFALLGHAASHGRMIRAQRRYDELPPLSERARREATIYSRKSACWRCLTADAMGLDTPRDARCAIRMSRTFPGAFTSPSISHSRHALIRDAIFSADCQLEHITITPPAD